MNILAFIIACLAVLVFGFAWWGVPAKRPLLPFGLALLTIAWVVSVVWQTVHQVVIH